MIVIVGHKSNVAKEFIEEVRRRENNVPYVERERVRVVGRSDPLSTDVSRSRWLLCNGLLASNDVSELTFAGCDEHFRDNLLRTIHSCEWALSRDDRARVCVIGSQSAWRGSHNMLYAALKAGAHGYVVGRKVKPTQQLVAVAPGVISDAGMTLRRGPEGQAALAGRKMVTAAEVARLCYSLLFDCSTAVTNCVVPIDGGER